MMMMTLMVMVMMIMNGSLTTPPCNGLPFFLLLYRCMPIQSSKPFRCVMVSSKLPSTGPSLCPTELKRWKPVMIPR